MRANLHFGKNHRNREVSLDNAGDFPNMGI